MDNPKIYSTNIIVPSILSIVLLFFLGLFILTNTLTFIKILIYIFALFGIWFIVFSYSVKIDRLGITSLYALGSKIFKIRQHIKWEDIIEITLNAAGMCVVIPKLPPERKYLRFKDTIIISKNIKNYKELVREIIANAKNAKINDTLRRQL